MNECNNKDCPMRNGQVSTECKFDDCPYRKSEQPSPQELVLFLMKKAFEGKKNG